MSQIDPYESTRLSLLDVAMDKLRMGNKKGMVHRVFITTKLESGLEKKDKKAIGSKLEKHLKHCSSQLSHENASGIMLMYNQHTLACLEASQEVIMLFLRELATIPALSECKILSFTENVPSRLFQHGWADASLPTRPLEQKLETSDSISQVLLHTTTLTNHLSQFKRHTLRLAIEEYDTTDSIHFIIQLTLIFLSGYCWGYASDS